MHLLKGLIKNIPLLKERRKNRDNKSKEKEERSSAPGGIRTHDLKFMRCCATTAACVHFSSGLHS